MTWIHPISDTRVQVSRFGRRLSGAAPGRLDDGILQWAHRPARWSAVVHPDQDVLRTILLKQQAFVFLRGYPVNFIAGDSFVVASGEYRAPLYWIERGYQTFPAFLRRLWGAAFVDAGNAWQGPFHFQQLKTDAGVEAHLLFSLGWYLEPQITLGWAHGFQSGGGNQLYFVASATF